MKTLPTKVQSDATRQAEQAWWSVITDTPVMAYLLDENKNEIAYMPKEAAQKVCNKHNACLVVKIGLPLNP